MSCLVLESRIREIVVVNPTIFFGRESILELNSRIRELLIDPVRSLVV
jgi:hypothetical protein